MVAQRSAPMVSVIMPLFNSERFLVEAIQSILLQSFEDFELIIVDDGSTDRSIRIAARYASRDRRVRLLVRQHTGIVGALQDGLTEARGRLIARMDADDIALSTRFEQQVRFLDEHENHVLVGTRVRMVDPKGLAICDFPVQTSHEEIDSAHLALQWAMVHPTVMMRTEAVEKAGGYRLSYETLEDLDLFLRLAEIGRLANLPDVLLKYRQHFSSICFLQQSRQNGVREALYREAYERRGLEMNRAAKEFRAPSRSQKNSWQRWAWLALEAGNVATARKHALSEVRRHPLAIDSWKLMYCALRGR